MGRRVLPPELQDLVDDLTLRLVALVQDLIEEHVEESVLELARKYPPEVKPPKKRPKLAATSESPPEPAPETIPEEPKKKPRVSHRERRKLLRARTAALLAKKTMSTEAPSPDPVPAEPLPESPAPVETEDSEEPTDPAPVWPRPRRVTLPLPVPVEQEDAAPPAPPPTIQPPAEVDWDSPIMPKPLRPEELVAVHEARVFLRLYEQDRPKTLADCMTATELMHDDAWVRANPGMKPVDGKNSARPCPWVACKHHLGIEVTDAGSLKIIKDWDDGRATCVLDIVRTNGSMTLETSGAFLGITRERMRQVEVRALFRAKRAKVELEDPPEHRESVEAA
jgi:hypothetical protein